MPDPTPQTSSPAAPQGARTGGPSAGAAAPSGVPLPPWASRLIELYESGACSQFIVHGNVSDRVLIPAVPAGVGGGGAGGSAGPAAQARPAADAAAPAARLGSLTEFILQVLLPRFDVVLSYDLANGLRVEKGEDTLGQWPALKGVSSMPREPGTAVTLVTRYARFIDNLWRLGRPVPHVGVFVRAAGLVVPAVQGASPYDLAALALNIRDWGADPRSADLPLATFLLTENVSDLHPLVANSPAASRIKVPLPTAEELAAALRALAPGCPDALREQPDAAALGAALAGATVASVEGMLKTRQHARRPVTDADLAALKKELVENQTGGLIDFVRPDRSLDDLQGQEKVKAWLRQDLALWRAGDVKALPMGYLFCGPVGTGKTFMVECLAGSAGVPVVRLKNFRDKWVGSTEANLETIFRLLHALGRCVVFIDEADQALGRRTADSGDSGVGGRVYSMFAEEMSNTRNRGKIVWVLASSRPDLIEVDLKRPGRIDVKIPLLPTATPDEGFALLRALCSRRGLDVGERAGDDLGTLIPALLTPGAAETLAVKVYRTVRTQGLDARAALRASLQDYQHPVPPDVMRFQIGLAVREASDLDFVPPIFRDYAREAPRA